MPTRLLIVAVTLTAVLGQLTLKRALAHLGASSELALMPRFLSAVVKSPWIYTSLAIQALGFLLWLLLMSREKLGVAAASVGAGFYILMPLCAWALYGESLTALQWLGMSLITLGVTCVSLHTS
jgi:drug/metabolite transporter (DMT)-like permease